MCPMDKMMAAQLSFLPLDSHDYNADVKTVLHLIESSGLQYTVGMFSTEVRGNRNRVMALVGDIYDTMEDRCSFVLDIKLSNTCGCDAEGGSS